MRAIVIPIQKTCLVCNYPWDINSPDETNNCNVCTGEVAISNSIHIYKYNWVNEPKHNSPFICSRNPAYFKVIDVGTVSAVYHDGYIVDWDWSRERSSVPTDKLLFHWETKHE